MLTGLAGALSPRLVASAGAAFTHQGGTLANPYRRAIVRTSLFPEEVPDLRERFTGFVSLSAYLGRGFALHLRQGLYADSWGVVAFIPEVGLAGEIFQGALVTAHYRMYSQSAAWFYQARYHDIEDIMTGDARLGPLREHAAGADAAWTFIGERGGFGAVSIEIGYEASLLDYEELSTDRVVAHLATAALTLSY